MASEKPGKPDAVKEDHTVRRTTSPPAPVDPGGIMHDPMESKTPGSPVKSVSMRAPGTSRGKV